MASPGIRVFTWCTLPHPPVSEPIPSWVCAQKIMRTPSRAQDHLDSDHGIHFQVLVRKPVCYNILSWRQANSVSTCYCKNESQKSVDDILLYRSLFNGNHFSSIIFKKKFWVTRTWLRSIHKCLTIYYPSTVTKVTMTSKFI